MNVMFIFVSSLKSVFFLSPGTCHFLRRRAKNSSYCTVPMLFSIIHYLQLVANGVSVSLVGSHGVEDGRGTAKFMF